MEKKGLAQRHTLDGTVKVITLVQLYLEKEQKFITNLKNERKRRLL